jgi:hypothetical protein
VEGPRNIITFEEFKKLDLRIAEIKNVERIEGADKLYKLTVDAGGEERQSECFEAPTRPDVAIDEEGEDPVKKELDEFRERKRRGEGEGPPAPGSHVAVKSGCPRREGLQDGRRERDEVEGCNGEKYREQDLEEEGETRSGGASICLLIVLFALRRQVPAHQMEPGQREDRKFETEHRPGHVPAEREGEEHQDRAQTPNDSGRDHRKLRREIYVPKEARRSTIAVVMMVALVSRGRRTGRLGRPETAQREAPHLLADDRLCGPAAQVPIVADRQAQVPRLAALDVEPFLERE